MCNLSIELKSGQAYILLLFYTQTGYFNLLTKTFLNFASLGETTAWQY
jgi:hypothetical protein